MQARFCSIDMLLYTANIVVKDETDAYVTKLNVCAYKFIGLSAQRPNGLLVDEV